MNGLSNLPTGAIINHDNLTSRTVTRRMALGGSPPWPPKPCTPPYMDIPYFVEMK
jgi:hypothetical protein